MDTLTETFSTINDATAKAITTFQEQVLAFHREVAAALGRFELPSWVPTPEPTTDVRVDDFVKEAYDFQAQRVQADKKFFLDLVDIWTNANANTSANASAKPATASSSK
jgi:hypothetical protein